MYVIYMHMHISVVLLNMHMYVSFYSVNTCVEQLQDAKIFDTSNSI